MTVYKRLVREVRSAGFLLFFVLTLATTSKADSVPDSIDVLQAAVPDSVSLAGKVVYVDFWASWCTPCRHSFPWMEELQGMYAKRGLQILTVNVDKDHAAAMKFLEDTGSDLTVLYDPKGELAKLYKLEAMPTTFIYGRDGHLVSKHLGFKQEEADSLDRVITKLLREGESK